MSPDAQGIVRHSRSARRTPTGGSYVCTIEITRRDRLAPCRGRYDSAHDAGEGPGAVWGAGQDRLLHGVDWPAVAERQAGAARHEDLGGRDQRQGRPARAPGQAHLLRRSERGGPSTGHLHQAARCRQSRSCHRALRHGAGGCGYGGRHTKEQGLHHPVRACGEHRVQLPEILRDDPDGAQPEAVLYRGLFRSGRGAEPEAGDSGADRRRPGILQGRLRGCARECQEARHQDRIRQNLSADPDRLLAGRAGDPGGRSGYRVRLLLSARLGRDSAHRERNRLQAEIDRRRDGRPAGDRDQAAARTPAQRLGQLRNLGPGEGHDVRGHRGVPQEVPGPRRRGGCRSARLLSRHLGLRLHPDPRRGGAGHQEPRRQQARRLHRQDHVQDHHGRREVRQGWRVGAGPHAAGPVPRHQERRPRTVPRHGHADRAHAGAIQNRQRDLSLREGEVGLGALSRMRRFPSKRCVRDTQGRRVMLLPTTLVGSYPQPEWLIDRAKLSKQVPRVRAHDLWRVDPQRLDAAQDDATLLAIRDQERAGLDIITDGEQRRESYSNRFATALAGIDLDNPGKTPNRTGGFSTVPRVVGPIRRKHPVEVRDVEFLRANTDRTIKMTVPGPFTMSAQCQNDFYDDEERLALDYAAAVNAEIKDLFAAGADVVQIDEPWMQSRPEKARKYGIKALDRALAGVGGTTALHICFGYAAVVKDKPSGYSFLPEFERSAVDQVSIEAAQPKLDLSVLQQLPSKTIILGVIDLSDLTVEAPETVAARIRKALPFAPADRIVVAPDCGLKYLPREVAFGKMRAMVEGAEIVRREIAG